MVGQAAPAEFVARALRLAEAHHPAMAVDVTRAYHFGARYNVEMEVGPPSCMRGCVAAVVGCVGWGGLGWGVVVPAWR